MSNGQGHIDRDKKADFYLDEHLWEAHGRAGEVEKHLRAAHRHCVGCNAEHAPAVWQLAARACQLDSDLWRLIDTIYPGRLSEDDDDDD